MATTLAATVKASFNWDYHNVSATVGDSQNTNSFSYSQVFTNGTAINQVDRLYVGAGTIAASGNTTVTLTSLADFMGNSLSFVRFKVAYCENTNATTSTSISFGNGTNGIAGWAVAATNVVKIRNGGCMLLCAPDATAYAITGGSSDVVKLLNGDGANSATYRLVVLGCSA